MSDLQRVLLVVATAGAVGGVINALTTDNGFALPKTETTSAGSRIVRPGFIGNVLLGTIAALLLFGLYGPLKDAVITGERPDRADAEETAPASLSLSALAGAVLTGVGGARLITAEVDKRLLQAAASEAASSQPDQSSGAEIAQAAPADALEIAKRMPDPNADFVPGGTG